MAKFRNYTKNGHKFWEVKGYIGTDVLTGKQTIITKRGFKTKKEAEFYLTKAKRDFASNQYVRESNATTFAEVYELWNKQYITTVTPSSASRTEVLFRKHILPLFANVKIVKINALQGQKLIDRLELSFKRKKLALSYIRRIFDYAITMQIIAVNPMLSVKVIEIKDDSDHQTKLKFYTKEELTRFLQTIEQSEESYLQVRDYALFRLLAFSGCRIGEIIALSWEDLQGRNLSINKTLAHGAKYYIATPKTKASIRTIALDDKTVATLSRWKITQAKAFFKLGINHVNYIFANPQNGFMMNQSIRDRYELYRTKTNLPDITLHGFRHTHASILFEAGVSMKEVQTRLGHSNITTTMNVYTHTSKKIQNETSDKFAKFMSI